MINRQDILNRAPDLPGRRLVTRDEVIPGAKLDMVHVDLDGKAEWPQPIQIDEEATGERGGTTYVFYHCDGHASQCFVPLNDFVGVKVEAESCGPFLTTLYLAKN